MPLDPQDLQRYHDEGFLVLRGLVDRDRLTRIAREVDGLHRAMAESTPPEITISWEEPRPGRPRRIRQLMHSERVCPSIEGLLDDAVLLAVVRQLIGPEVALFHSKLMMKAAHDGSFTPWHQDWGYWRHEARVPSQVNAMLAIDPQADDNGCIRFVPGSHRDGYRSHNDFATSSFNIGLPGDLDAYAAVSCVMEPGDVVFFGPLVIHASAPNTSGAHRRANTFAFDRSGNRLAGAPLRQLRSRAPDRA